MVDRPTDLARLGLAVADVMERSGSPASAGIVRRLAALVVDMHAHIAATSPTTPNGCPVCGGPVEQPATGRRRKYCCEEHRRQAQREQRARNVRNGRMVA